MSAAVEKAAAAGSEAEVWFSGLVGSDDFDSLKEMADAKAQILFPGVMMGFKDE